MDIGESGAAEASAELSSGERLPGDLELLVGGHDEHRHRGGIGRDHADAAPARLVALRVELDAEEAERRERRRRARGRVLADAGGEGDGVRRRRARE